MGCSDVKDGPQLTPMHPLHGPGGALLATLPQWPRIKPIGYRQYRQSIRFVIPDPMKIFGGRRRNLTGTWGGFQKYQVAEGLGERFRPRHYCASLSSDADARTSLQIPLRTLTTLNQSVTSDSSCQ